MADVAVAPRAGGAQWRVYDRRSLSAITQLQRLPPELVASIRLATLVFPFKVNDYVLDNLIDWSHAPDDPMFRLVFPVADMLEEADRWRLARLTAINAAPEEVAAAVAEIRAAMNPDSSEQSTNVPDFEGQRADGIQHKYRETVLAFPRQGQTCHSYCSFCFRWPQFTRPTPPKFELRSPEILHGYLRAHPEASELLLTGGDPMVMSARRLAEILEPLLAPAFDHIRVVRIGTKALTYWPHRFFEDDDADALLEIVTRLVAAGKHLALMAHINHWRELEPAAFQKALYRLQQAGAVVRTQAPLLRGINDDAATWRRNWSEQVRLGLIPYYMFIERDTGASRYFAVPIARALDIYRDATQGLSGLGRTARGPVMSASPGKVHVLGTFTLDGRKYFALTFLRARDPQWMNRLFLAKYSETATWLSELSHGDGPSFFFEEAPAAIAGEIAARIRPDGS